MNLGRFHWAGAAIVWCFVLGPGLTSLSAGWVLLRDGTRLAGKVSLAKHGIALAEAGGGQRSFPWTALEQAVFDGDAVLSDAASTNPPSARVSWQHAVDLNQSANDTINGLQGKWTRADQEERNTRPGLTDAETATAPDADNGWFAGEVVWDLGQEPPAVERQLDKVSIWIKAHDPRCDYSGWLAVSESGSEFLPLPGTHTNIWFSTMPEKARKGDFNQVVYEFPPGVATEFRYLKLVVNRPESTGYDSRFVEVDAFVSRIPGKPVHAATVLLRNGTRLRGELEGIDEAGLVFRAGKSLYKTPLASLAAVYLKRVPVEYSKTLTAGRSGVLLANGDFYDGDIVSVAGGSVQVSSVIFGARKFGLRPGVLAILFHQPSLSPATAMVSSRDGSRYRAQALAFEASRLTITDSILGQVVLDESDLLELRRDTD